LLALSESLYYEIRQQQWPIDISVAFPSFINTGLLSHDAVMNRLMRMGREPADVAERIMKAAEQGVFYIFPDAEVKNYLQDWIQSPLEQKEPVQHDMEQLIHKVRHRFA